MERVLDKLLEALLGRILANVVCGWVIIILGAFLAAWILYGLVQTVWERSRGRTQTTEEPALWILGLLLLIPVLFACFLLYGGISLLSTARQDETFNRGVDALATKDYDKAIKNFTEVIRRNPKQGAAYNNRGLAYSYVKEYDKAISDYNEAIRLNSKGKTTAYTNLAWLLATCPKDELRDGKRAVELARKACDLSDWKDANDLGNLAAAYAECGDFNEATKWQRRAARDPGTGLQDTARARQMLKLYEEGKPYRDE